MKLNTFAVGATLAAALTLQSTTFAQGWAEPDDVEGGSTAADDTLVEEAAPRSQRQTDEHDRVEPPKRQAEPEFDPYDWEPGDPVPRGYREVTRIRKGLVVGGAVMLGVSWMVTAGIGAILTAVDDADSSTDTKRFQPLLIPVAGPFVTIFTANANSAGMFPLLMSGLVQTGGLAMLVAGIVAPQRSIKRVPQVGQLEFTPLLGPGLTGMGVSGTF